MRRLLALVAISVAVGLTVFLGNAIKWVVFQSGATLITFETVAACYIFSGFFAIIACIWMLMKIDAKYP